MKKCIGCGSVLQTIDDKKIGYTKTMDNKYCLRCFRIKNYNDLIDQEIDQNKFITNISEIIKNDKKPIFYYVIDLFDLNGSRILKLEKLIKDYEVIIIVNKIDLMPKSIKLAKIRKYIEKIFKNSELSNYKIFLTTAFKPNFIEPLLFKILKKKENQYFIGSSNVGKSTLINSLMRQNNLIPTVVESRYFNTTLDFIEIKLTEEVKIIDTPGISRSNSMALLTNKDQWQYFYFKKEIKQYTYQLSKNQAICFGSIAWIEFNNFEQKVNIHAYTNSQIDLHRTKSENALNYISKNIEILKPKIKSLNKKVYRIEFVFDKILIGKKYDIVLSGLGWISFTIHEEMAISIVIPTKNTNNDINSMIELREALI